MSIEELKVAMADALNAGDDSKVLELASQIHKAKADVLKAEAEKVKAENEALAGERERLAKDIHKVVKNMPELVGLFATKCFGFTYKMDGYPDEGITYKSVALIVPTVKGKGGTGGGAGKTKDEFGMSLQDIIEKFATPDELAKIDGASSNSQSWQFKTQVKKRVLAEGLIKPTK